VSRWEDEDDDHDEACNGTVVEDDEGRGWTCSSGCGWSCAYGTDVTDYQDIDHDPRGEDDYQ